MVSATPIDKSTGNKRVQAAARTRENLLQAGLALAERLGLEGLSVNAVVDAAGVSKGTFFHHFRDRVSYLVALHRRFHDSPQAPARIWTGACSTAASRRCSSRPAACCRCKRRYCGATG